MPGICDNDGIWVLKNVPVDVISDFGREVEERERVCIRRRRRHAVASLIDLCGVRECWTRKEVTIRGAGIAGTLYLADVTLR